MLRCHDIILLLLMEYFASNLIDPYLVTIGILEPTMRPSFRIELLSAHSVGAQSASSYERNR